MSSNLLVTIDGRLKELNKTLSQIRVVKEGDFVLPNDHNLQTTALLYTRDILQLMRDKLEELQKAPPGVGVTWTKYIIGETGNYADLDDAIDDINADIDAGKTNILILLQPSSTPYTWSKTIDFQNKDSYIMLLMPLASINIKTSTPWVNWTTYTTVEFDGLGIASYYGSYQVRFTTAIEIGDIILSFKYLNIYSDVHLTFNGTTLYLKNCGVPGKVNDTPTTFVRGYTSLNLITSYVTMYIEEGITDAYPILSSYAGSSFELWAYSPFVLYPSVYDSQVSLYIFSDMDYVFDSVYAYNSRIIVDCRSTANISTSIFNYVDTMLGNLIFLENFVSSPQYYIYILLHGIGHNVFYYVAPSVDYIYFKYDVAVSFNDNYCHPKGEFF